ncbi:hypothetical protein QRX50_10180 [Amycolatopsis carbonis]|uniref:Uncharacterized protein n=1 Tax=Amycolatopsis carbonis TaxID=715471 RepID=A0A9Y2IJ71_9PSEU|nr:hypothetical protein [Amycolatopsis sp. 2-15]WIX81097.1 hypothetical protein QRX50_10180 [Amycolatopsis sp. 2-15]
MSTFAPNAGRGLAGTCPRPDGGSRRPRAGTSRRAGAGKGLRAAAPATTTRARGRIVDGGGVLDNNARTGRSGR